MSDVAKIVLYNVMLDSGSPKIMYRSDTSQRLYCLMPGKPNENKMIIHIVDDGGTGRVGVSDIYELPVAPSRKPPITEFFDFVEKHLNGRWKDENKSS